MGIELSGRVALVTGAANGIGRATALTFARAGAVIAAWDMAEPAGHSLVEEIRQAGRQHFQASMSHRSQRSRQPSR